MAHLLCDILLKLIDTSYYIELCWGKDETWIRHTSIVLKFNGEPFCTIDYGPTEGQFGTIGSVAISSKKSIVACTALAFGSSVYVNDYKISKPKIVGKLLEFALSSRENKKRAIDLLVQISQLDMGDYHLTKNNCRDFVSKAMDIISDNKIRYDNDAGEDHNSRSNRLRLRRVENEDNAIGVGGAALIAGLGILAGYGIYKAVKSNERSHQNQ